MSSTILIKGRKKKMPKKRKSRGRAKGRKGRSKMVQCSSCGSLVPRDKAKKVTQYKSLVDWTLGKELRAQGAYFTRHRVEKYYCISCAVHRRVVKVRAKAERTRSY
jgi:small subunit ribosomal protein S26e